jgi:hypothetical protein
MASTTFCLCRPEDSAVSIRVVDVFIFSLPARALRLIACKSVNLEGGKHNSLL